ncbi:Methyltransferase small domain-containing protein [Raineyella antarctica]|uniref:Methyltransferase small domain-containing protein n=1 Tax=Raineyella antarctica TaxID=1577474 RepID=A0A1G6HZU2_9ACTN|nr:Methyltransferase small domain-containing protein [Raineyella antarctica]
MTEHYFRTPEGEEHRRTIHARLWDHQVELQTANGVFSGTRLDPATAVLLREVPPPDRTVRRVADVGCGYGPIALGLALACPWLQVDAVDTNERALALTRDNAAALGVADRVRALSPDEVDPTATYDEIWSNPPIRIGKDALHELLLGWLARLAPQGRAVMVVGKNLGADSLQRWLGEQGWPTDRLASAKGFRVLETRPPAAV